MSTVEIDVLYNQEDWLNCSLRVEYVLRRFCSRVHLAVLKGAFVAAERRSPTSVRFRFLFCFTGHSSYRHEGTSSHSSLRNSGAFTPIRVIHATESSQRFNLGIISGVRQKVFRDFFHMRV